MSHERETRGADSGAALGSALECQGCKWWQADDEDDADNTAGICRRNPPQLSGGSYGFVSSVFGFIWRSSETEWPATDAFDYCGEHTPNGEL